jgi:putative endonuclease
MTHNIEVGTLGEQLAREFLERNGCKIIDKNFNTRYGEIDLIAKSGDEILFVEVKTRTSSKYGYPEYAVDRKKISHLLRALMIYMKIRSIRDFWRMDIVSVELDMETRKAKISWFKNVSMN